MASVNEYPAEVQERAIRIVRAQESAPHPAGQDRIDRREDRLYARGAQVVTITARQVEIWAHAQTISEMKPANVSVSAVLQQIDRATSSSTAISSFRSR